MDKNTNHVLSFSKENAINFLEQNPDYARSVELQIREQLFPGQVLRTKEGVAVYPEQEKAAKAAKSSSKDEKGEKAEKPEPKTKSKSEPKAEVPASEPPTVSPDDALF